MAKQWLKANTYNVKKRLESYGAVVKIVNDNLLEVYYNGYRVHYYPSTKSMRMLGTISLRGKCPKFTPIELVEHLGGLETGRVSPPEPKKRMNSREQNEAELAEVIESIEVLRGVDGWWQLFIGGQDNFRGKERYYFHPDSNKWIPVRNGSEYRCYGLKDCIERINRNQAKFANYARPKELSEHKIVGEGESLLEAQRDLLDKMFRL